MKRTKEKNTRNKRKESKKTKEKTGTIWSQVHILSEDRWTQGKGIFTRVFSSNVQGQYTSLRFQDSLNWIVVDNTKYRQTSSNWKTEQVDVNLSNEGLLVHKPYNSKTSMVSLI